jgi:hypothetical protein
MARTRAICRRSSYKLKEFKYCDRIYKCNNCNYIRNFYGRILSNTYCKVCNNNNNEMIRLINEDSRKYWHNKNIEITEEMTVYDINGKEISDEDDIRPFNLKDPSEDISKDINDINNDYIWINDIPVIEVYTPQRGRGYGGRSKLIGWISKTSKVLIAKSNEDIGIINWIPEVGKEIPPYPWDLTATQSRYIRIFEETPLGQKEANEDDSESEEEDDSESEEEDKNEEEDNESKDKDENKDDITIDDKDEDKKRKREE